MKVAVAEGEQRRAEEDSFARRRKAEEEGEVEDESKEDGEKQCEHAGAVAAVRVESAQTKMMEEGLEMAAAQKALAEFLKAHGFTQMGLPRKSFCGASKIYPLHVAAEENNVEVVRAMVTCSAYLQPRNSSRKTPLDIAEQCNKGGSHDLVLTMLRVGER